MQKPVSKKLCFAAGLALFLCLTIFQLGLVETRYHFAQDLPFAFGLVGTENEDLSNNCFYFSMTLQGNHSEHRSEAAFKWLTDVSLASVNLAASETKGNRVDLFLTLHDAYERLAARVDPLKYPRVSIYQPKAASDVISVVKDRDCERATFVRLDADDVLSPTYLKRLNLALREQEDIEAGCVINYGSIKLDKIVMARREDGSLGCEHSVREHRPDSRDKYQFSLGQAVSILVEDWLTYMPGRTSFDDHRYVKKTLQSLMKEEKGKVKRIQIHDPGYYMLTSLSGHFPYEKPETCELSDVDHRIEKLLQDNFNAVPKLSAKEFNENVFVVEKQLPERANGTWWR